MMCVCLTRSNECGCFAGKLKWMWPFLVAIGWFLFAIIMIFVIHRPRTVLRVAATSKKTGTQHLLLSSDIGRQYVLQRDISTFTQQSTPDKLTHMTLMLCFGAVAEITSQIATSTLACHWV